MLIDALVQVASQHEEREHEDDVADPKLLRGLQRHRLHDEAATDTEEEGHLVTQAHDGRLLKDLAHVISNAVVLLAGDLSTDLL